MKLITLNIWGGHVHDPLLKFIQTHREIDIFCLQEVYHRADRKNSDEDRKVYLDIFLELHEFLPNHDAYFKPVVNGSYGIGMFVKKSINVLAEGEVIIHENPEYSGIGPAHSRNLQWVECSHQNKTYTIMNVHGLWNGQGKTDSLCRIQQSQRIIQFIDQVNTPKILCGDFNLRPDTEALKLIHGDMNNLIQQYGVSDTRTSYYKKPERFADYVFTSGDIEVKHFSVMQDEVSDHSPLLVEFE